MFASNEWHGIYVRVDFVLQVNLFFVLPEDRTQKREEEMKNDRNQQNTTSIIIVLIQTTLAQFRLEEKKKPLAEETRTTQTIHKRRKIAL